MVLLPQNQPATEQQPCICNKHGALAATLGQTLTGKLLHVMDSSLLFCNSGNDSSQCSTT
eukprot:2474709-Rhodomonas_salina.1